VIGVRRRERERMTSFFALLALGSHECACPHIGEKERETTVSSETWIKDERGDERKHPEESVCVVGRH